MLLQLFIALHVVVLVSPSSALAQTYRVVDIDRAFDINNDLVGVGVKGDGRAPFIPHVLSPNGTQSFPELSHLFPMRINNSGAVVGTAYNASRVFRVGRNGSSYSEIAVPYFGGPPMFAGVLRLTDGGVALLLTYVQGRITTHVTGHFLWDGFNVVSVESAYNPPPFSRVFALGEDGTIGGTDGMPFLQRQGEPLIRPWSGPGQVSDISTAGHVVGDDGAGTVIMRRPDGSILRFPGMRSAFVAKVNRSGDFVGTYYNDARSRTEPFLVRNGQLIDLNAHFNSPDESLFNASDITDSGVILATVAPSFRFVLLVPLSDPPVGVVAHVQGRFVSVSWQAVPGASEYIVEAGSGPGSSNLFHSSVGSQSSISGVVPSGRYYVRVRARNVAGLSDPSEEVVVHVQ